VSDRKIHGVEAVGVDGARGGWIACPSTGPLCLFTSFEALVRTYPGARFLVDIPQGLTHGERDLESCIRERLRGQTSSVFSVPSRRAVYAGSYEEACQLNLEAQGKKISLQSWYICSRIREVDQALLKTPSWQRRIHEAHPELCFRELSGSHLPSKKTSEGQVERLALLEKMQPGQSSRYESALKEYPRRDVAPDDLLDAMVLSLTGARGFSIVRGKVRRDEKGLAIRLAVPDTLRFA